MTVVDHRSTTWVKPPNVRVCESIDVDAAKAVLHADLLAFATISDSTISK